MIRPVQTLRSTSRFLISVAALLSTLSLYGQKRMAVAEDTVKVSLFRGFAVSVDLAGAIQKAVSDYGQYEAALRINLRDKYFPIVEAGIGKADHDDAVSKISYSSSAPYFRIGVDFNMMKQKHDVNRIYVGVRYGFSSFKYDVHHPGVKDPIWKDISAYDVDDVSCNYHWAELVAGVDAKIWGPFHLGWSARYRRRISYDNGPLGNVWYVPGYGKSGNTRMGGTFNVTIDI